MVDLTAYQPPWRSGSPHAGHGTGQRALWRGYDLCLAVATLTAAGDIPNRWGLASELWMLIYAMAVLRVLTVWPAFFRLLARNRVFLIYPAICLLSVIWSLDRPTSMVGAVQMTMTTVIALFLGWRFDPRQLLILAFGTLMAGLLASTLNWATGAFQPLYSNVGGLLGIYTNKNMLGHYSLFALMIAMSMALSRPGTVSPMLRPLALLAIALAPVLTLMSKSMTAIVLLPLFAGLVLLLNRHRLPAWVRYGAMAAIVLTVALAPLLLTAAGIDPLDRLFAATGKDATLTGRTQLWALAADQIARAPLTGIGFGAVWTAPGFEALRFEVLRAGATAPSFHDVFADIGVGTGLLGIAAMVALVLTTLGRAFRFWRFDGGAISVACLVTVLLPIALALVEPYLYRQHEFMLSWMIMLGVSLGQHPAFRFPQRVKARFPR